MTHKKSIDVLNDLIETSRDGAEGFRKCAEDANDPQLESYFLDRAESCEQAVQTLTEEIRKYGGKLDTSGTFRGALHRLWIDVRTALTDKDNLAVLEECERAEDVAVKTYQDALKEEMPESLRSLITRQLDGVKRNHDRIRELRVEAENNPMKA
ncbi:PA2169 family four-helix-bundle protein [Nitrosomonas sp. JL21]|uniref:ferritin-like domain-containing protein n=1 Tax=Nitrosomonas sp. JL21 TaxID=153949 RepID=UPI00136BF6FF|nr:PA2169 family four-helix-bundle protein [Nitrosomonas sp. JL21]MBL8496476.1 PA2169 family four-helix-bundle protein [Nitrosomonas sp.]MCC7091119.1 PA2169 family four-helix-bundle protein [Nitrosomonas sp.]MXS77033.1 PA2169 family four-helix-bundle protein [Nitrosomonas sp. JL21]